MLTPDQIAQLDRDGFLVLPDFATPEACAELRARALEIVDEWEPGAARTAFTTIKDDRPRNEEFLASGGITWCFFEEEAFGPTASCASPRS
jgi:phytanoyl-CoA hydroxylase